MNMNARTAIGAAGLVLAIAAWFTTGAAAWLSIAALLLATVAAALRCHLLALATVAVVLVKTFFVDPTLWSLIAGDTRPGRDRSVDAIRVFLLLVMVAPFIAIGVNYVYARLTDWLIATFAIVLLVGFLTIIIQKVTEIPLIIVVSAAVLMGIYDFTRELRHGPGDSRADDESS